MVGIGLESLGLEEFLEGKYFAGDLFVDKKKASYGRLGFPRLGGVELLTAMLSRKWLQAGARVFSTSCCREAEQDTEESEQRETL